MADGLNRAQVRRAAKVLKAEGKKLPRVGYCLRNLPERFPARELCRAPVSRFIPRDTGYYFVGYRVGRRTDDFKGHAKGRRR